MPLPTAPSAGNLDLLKVSLPVKMFEPRSYLQKLADPWVRALAAPGGGPLLRGWCGWLGRCKVKVNDCKNHPTPLQVYPRFLQQAAAAQDPVERLQAVVAFFIAGGGRGLGCGAGLLRWCCGPHCAPALAGSLALPASGSHFAVHTPATHTAVPPPPPRPGPPGFHRAFTRWAKPFNPVLGETWQAAGPDGSRIWLEQVSHHPPISAFQLAGPHGAYTFTGQRSARRGAWAAGV